MKAGLGEVTAISYTTDGKRLAAAGAEGKIRIWDGAMDTGGEAEAWRGMVLARALLCAGRIDEARSAAEQSSQIAREREMLLRELAPHLTWRPGR